jgi:cyclopropane fatty-acyl-phospholipid synthase-like methyltransferase
MSLNLYARVEDLLGIEEATASLHELYTHLLVEHGVSDFIDIGCGRGGLLETAAEAGITGYGVDLSSVMVDAARAKGLKAECCDVCDATGSYDAAVAVFDVLNFLDAAALERFVACVAGLLRPGGIFLADINTLHGFSHVAEGTMSAEDESRFLTVDAAFAGNELHTRFTLFTRSHDGRYDREDETIVQYFHPIKRLRRIGGLKLVEQHGLTLYDRDDKTLLVLKKPTA